jgi:hypothetical protein
MIEGYIIRRFKPASCFQWLRCLDLIVYSVLVLQNVVSKAAIIEHTLLDKLNKRGA